MKREIRAAADKALPQDQAPFDFSLLPVIDQENGRLTTKSGAVSWYKTGEKGARSFI